MMITHHKKGEQAVTIRLRAGKNQDEFRRLEELCDLLPCTAVYEGDVLFELSFDVPVPVK